MEQTHRTVGVSPSDLTPDFPNNTLVSLNLQAGGHFQFQTYLQIYSWFFVFVLLVLALFVANADHSPFPLHNMPFP